jgi:hypothetical protein
MNRIFIIITFYLNIIWVNAQDQIMLDLSLIECGDFECVNLPYPEPVSAEPGFPPLPWETNPYIAPFSSCSQCSSVTNNCFFTEISNGQIFWHSYGDLGSDINSAVARLPKGVL